MSLPTRKIGERDVTAMGYGAMGIAAFYGTPLRDEERFKVSPHTRYMGDDSLIGICSQILDAVYANGCTNWDTADAYADSEILIGKWSVCSSNPLVPRSHDIAEASISRFKKTGKRNEIFLATRFGFVMGGGSTPSMNIRADPEYVPQALNKSLERLGVDQIDLWYLHRSVDCFVSWPWLPLTLTRIRADRNVPIEVSTRTRWRLRKSDVLLVDGTRDGRASEVRRFSYPHALVLDLTIHRAGKVKYLGLSEVSAETLRRAHAVHPISALQVEYSPFALDIEDEKVGLLKTARELGITIVAYSPVGRGLLTGKIVSSFFHWVSRNHHTDCVE